jgi:hypothetical protein
MPMTGAIRSIEPLEVEVEAAKPKTEDTKIEEEQPKKPVRKQEVTNLFEQEYEKLEKYYNEVDERKATINEMTDEDKIQMKKALETTFTQANKVLPLVPNTSAKPVVDARIHTWMNQLNRLYQSDDLRIGPSSGTRSQGPATIGQELATEFYDPQGHFIYKGKSYELAGKTYEISDYILNLIKHARSNENKNFKEAFQLRQKDLGDKASWTSKRYVDSAIATLEEALSHNKPKVALVMDYIIKNNKSNIFAEFATKYNRDYAQFNPLKKV